MDKSFGPSSVDTSESVRTESSERSDHNSSPRPDPMDTGEYERETSSDTDLVNGDQDTNLDYVNVESSQSRNKVKSSGKACAKKVKKPRKTAQGYVCDICQPKRYFKKTKVLSEHKTLLHGSTPHPCLWCGKQFFNESQLLVHQKLYAHDKPLD